MARMSLDVGTAAVAICDSFFFLNYILDLSLGGYDYSACMCMLSREIVSSLNWHHQWL